MKSVFRDDKDGVIFRHLRNRCGLFPPRCSTLGTLPEQVQPRSDSEMARCQLSTLNTRFQVLRFISGVMKAKAADVPSQ